MEDSNSPARKGDVEAVRVDVKAVRADVEAVRLDVRAVQVDVKAVQVDVEDVRVHVEAVRVDLQLKIDLLRSEVNHRFDDVVERISDGETRLLKAFYDFAQSNQKRLTVVEENESSLRSRIATLEDRLLNVERRLNMPPAA